jgi:hypothetical protein
MYLLTEDLALSSPHQSAKYRHLTLRCAISGLFLPAVVRPILDSWAVEEQVAPTPLKDVCVSPQNHIYYLCCDFINICFYEYPSLVFQPHY